jgi:two-component system chemotaxis response regulator CheB
LTPHAGQTRRRQPRHRRALVVGGSLGAARALVPTLRRLPPDCIAPVIVALHLHRSDGGRLAEHLGRESSLPVVEARDKEEVSGGKVHVAPPDYHLLVEADETLSLSIDPPVRWSRPSIDVLFESAARTWRENLLGVLLSGANEDGARGMAWIARLGGECLIQDPETAEGKQMPAAALEQVPNGKVLSPAEIAEWVALRLSGKDVLHED